MPAVDESPVSNEEISNDIESAFDFDDNNDMENILNNKKEEEQPEEELEDIWKF